MVKSREELRHELALKAEVLIEEVLDWCEASEEPNFSEIEEQVLQLRQKLSEEMVRLIIEQQESVRPTEAPRCPQCQQAMQYKGDKEKTVDCLVGQVPIRRAYYHCGSCKQGLFSPGQTA